MPDFGREDAISLYNVDRWGEGYFTVNRKGHMVVLPNRSSDQKIDLMEVVAEAKRRKLGFPLTVRFQDLLRDRVETINKAFADAIETRATQRLSRRVSDQGEPAARSGRRDHGRGRAVSFWDRGGEQAGAAGGARGASR